MSRWGWLVTREGREDWSGDIPVFEVRVIVRRWHPGYWLFRGRLWWDLLRRSNDDDDSDDGYQVRKVWAA